MNGPGITFAIFKEIMNEKFLGLKKGMNLQMEEAD